MLFGLMIVMIQELSLIVKGAIELFDKEMLK